MADPDLSDIERRMDGAQEQQPSPLEQMQMKQLEQQLEEQALKNDKLELDNTAKQIEIENSQKTPLEQAAEEEQSIADVENTEADTDKKRSETLKNEHEVRRSVIEIQTPNDSQNL